MKDFYNTFDAGMVFGVMPETVRQWYKEGKINGRKNGPRNRIMFRKSDILDFMRDNPKYGSIVCYAKLFWYPDMPRSQLQVNVTMLQIELIKYLNEHPKCMSTIKKSIERIKERNKVEG